MTKSVDPFENFVSLKPQGTPLTIAKIEITPATAEEGRRLEDAIIAGLTSMGLSYDYCNADEFPMPRFTTAPTGKNADVVVVLHRARGY